MMKNNQNIFTSLKNLKKKLDIVSKQRPGELQQAYFLMFIAITSLFFTTFYSYLFTWPQYIIGCLIPWYIIKVVKF